MFVQVANFYLAIGNGDIESNKQFHATIVPFRAVVSISVTLKATN